MFIPILDSPSLPLPPARCPQPRRLWAVELPQNIVLTSKAQPSCWSQPLDPSPPHDPGLSQPVALAPQTLGVLQVNSGGSPWSLLPECQTTNTQGEELYLPSHQSTTNIQTKTIPPAHVEQVSATSASHGVQLELPPAQGNISSRVRSSRQDISQQREN